MKLLLAPGGVAWEDRQDQKGGAIRMAFALLPVIAAAALAVSGALPQKAALAAEAPAPAEKKICRMIVPTGSIMGKRFCLTKQEWSDLNSRTQESAGSALTRRGTGMCDIQCPGSGS